MSRFDEYKDEDDDATLPAAFAAFGCVILVVVAIYLLVLWLP